MMKTHGREAFREALLDKKPETGWRRSRIHHQTFYMAKFRFEGRDVRGKELIEDYKRRFPSGIDYTLRAELNRMFSDCGIRQFSFLDPENLRGFLLSAMSLAEWAEFKPNVRDFRDLAFQYAGIRLRGQMLLHNVAVEVLNQINGTHYAFLDYSAGPKLRAGLLSSNESGLMQGIFFTVEIPVIYKYKISESGISPEFLRTVLLGAKSEDEWRKWGGTSDDFYKMRFEPELYEGFSGLALTERYRGTKGGHCSIKEMFAEAGLEIGTDPSVADAKKTNHYGRYYYYDLLDPVVVRNLLLQAYSQEEWKKPKDAVEVRKRTVRIEGKECRGEELTLHTLMQLYCVQRYNCQQEQETGKPSHITLNEMQNSSNLKKLLKSNIETIKEMLELAGIDYGNAFVPSITALDLLNPSVLKRILLNRIHEPVGMSEIEGFRKTKFCDPKTGVEIKGHGLMLYYSASKYVREHPEITVDKAAFELKIGKSNNAVMAEMMELAGIRKSSVSGAEPTSS